MQMYLMQLALSTPHGNVSDVSVFYTPDSEQWNIETMVHGHSVRVMNGLRNGGYRVGYINPGVEPTPEEKVEIKRVHEALQWYNTAAVTVALILENIQLSKAIS